MGKKKWEQGLILTWRGADITYTYPPPIKKEIAQPPDSYLSPAQMMLDHVIGHFLEGIALEPLPVHTSRVDSAVEMVLDRHAGNMLGCILVAGH